MSEVHELNGPTNNFVQHEETNGHHEHFESHEQHKTIEPVLKATIPSITTENNDEEDARAEEELNQLSTGIVDEILPPSNTVVNGEHSEVHPDPVSENPTTPEVSQPEPQTDNVESPSQSAQAEVSPQVEANDEASPQPAESMIAECGSEAEITKPAETPVSVEFHETASATNQVETHTEPEPQNEPSQVNTASENQPEEQNSAEEAPIVVEDINHAVEQVPAEVKPDEAESIPASAHELQQEAHSEAQNQNIVEALEHAESHHVPQPEQEVQEVAEVERVESPPLSHHSVHDEPLVKDEPEPLKDQLLNPHHVEEVKEPEPPHETSEKVEVHDVAPLAAEPPQATHAAVPAEVLTPPPPSAAVVVEQKETVITQETPCSEPQATSSVPVEDSKAVAESQQNTSGSSNKASTLPRRYFEAARKRCTII